MNDCGCITHPGETHAEHIDRFDREQNTANIQRAMERMKNATSYGELAHARALLAQSSAAEIRRLSDREQNMLNGSIRIKCPACSQFYYNNPAKPGCMHCGSTQGL